MIWVKIIGEQTLLKSWFGAFQTKNQTLSMLAINKKMIEKQHCPHVICISQPRELPRNQKGQREIASGPLKYFGGFTFIN